MIVKTNRKYRLAVTWLSGILVALAAVLFLAIGFWVGSVILLCISIPLVISNDMLLSKTVTFSAEGCSIVFRKNVTFVRWEELAVKRVEPPHLGRNGGYCEGGVFFSLVPCKKDPIVDPSFYGLFHLNTCFWVYFRPNQSGKKHFGVYEVDKYKFLRRLREWNVDLEFKC